MSARSEVAAQLQGFAEEMQAAISGWSSRQRSGALAPAVAAVEECSAILTDAAAEVLKPARERVTA